MVKVGNIVKRASTNELYEVIKITGLIASCKALNVSSSKAQEVPLLIAELEVMMDEGTEALNILFGDDDGT